MATVTTSKPKLTRVQKYERAKAIAERCKAEFAADVAVDFGLAYGTIISICADFGVQPRKKQRGRTLRADWCKDITGQQFGRLTAERLTDRRDERGYAIWECRCECGELAEKSVRQLSVITKHGCRTCQINSTRDPKQAEIAGMLLKGHTLEEVGSVHGLTRERVRQKAGKQKVWRIGFWASASDVAQWTRQAEAKGMKLGGYINSVLRDRAASEYVANEVQPF